MVRYSNVPYSIFRRGQGLGRSAAVSPAHRKAISVSILLRLEAGRLNPGKCIGIGLMVT